MLTTRYVQHTIDEDIEIDKRVATQLAAWKKEHPFLSGYTFGIATDRKEKELRENAFRDIKSEQLKEAEKYKNKQVQLQKKEAELNAREKALAEREAKLNTNVAKISKDVENRVNSANQKAKTLNRQIDGMVKKTK